jgi:hypothetical protein
MFSIIYVVQTPAELISCNIFPRPVLVKIPKKVPDLEILFFKWFVFQFYGLYLLQQKVQGT